MASRASSARGNAAPNPTASAAPAAAAASAAVTPAAVAAPSAVTRPKAAATQTQVQAPAPQVKAPAPSPTHKVMKQLAAPKVVSDGVLVALSEISTSRQSGWMDVDQVRVDELKAAFLRGEYGQNLLRKPSILQDCGSRKMCPDGLLKLADGKHTIVALQQISALVARAGDAGSGEEVQEFSQALLSVFQDGVAVTVLEFEEYDDDVAVAWAVGLRDVEVNKYKSTAIQDLVAVAIRYKARVPGGTWKATQAALEQLYGVQRRTMVYRMVAAAKYLSPAVLDRLARSHLPNSYIFDNKYFIPTGTSTSSMLLGEAWQLAVIDVGSADIEERRQMSADYFASDYCSPFRYAQSWVAVKRKEFGKFADLPAFGRVEAWLQSARARIPIMQCVRTRVKLDGNSDEQPGIEQCRTIVKELNVLKTKPNAQEGSGVGDAASSAADADPAADGGDQISLAERATGLTSISALAVTVGGPEEVDEVRVQADAKTDVAMTRINYYKHDEGMISGLKSLVMPGSKVMIHIDAPTSKQSVVSKLVDKVEALVKLLPTRKLKIVVTTGSRVDILSNTYNKLQLAFPSMQVYWVSLTHGDKQHKKRRNASMLVAVPHDATEDMPTTIKALAARARRGEQTFLRCLDYDCPLRPLSEVEAVEHLAGSMQPSCELHPDDMDCEVEGEAAAGAEDGEDDDEPVPPAAAEPARKFVVDLWPFAYGREYFKHIAVALFGAASLPSHLVYLSTTAHPGAVLAAHDSKMQCHVLLDRVREHSAAHGLKLLRECISNEYYKQEKKQQAAGTKRWLSSELTFVLLQASPDQPMLFADASTKPTTPSWRAVMDQAPSPSDLEVAIPRLIGSELDGGNFFVQDDSGSKVLHTARGIKDQDVIAVVRCLFFSEPRILAEFVNNDSNSALLDGPLVCVSGIETSDGVPMSVYCVQLGITMFIKDFRGRRARPNAAWRVHPGEGTNDGFLVFVAQSQNASGIRAGQPILADFGETYRQTVGDMASAPAKRFRSSLDAIFKKQAEALTADEAAVGITPAVKPIETVDPPPRLPPIAPTEVASSGAWSLSFCPTAGFQLSTKAASTRVPPKTVLHVFTNAIIDASKPDAADNMAFQFTKPKEQVVEYGGRVLTTLADIIKEAKVEAMFGHTPFTKGVPPPSFVAKKVNRFNPKTDFESEMLKKAHAQVGQKVHLVWAVAAEGNKIMPKGIALVTKKEITAKADGPVSLS